jgi:hypothetical protein
MRKVVAIVPTKQAINAPKKLAQNKQLLPNAPRKK